MRTRHLLPNIAVAALVIVPPALLIGQPFTILRIAPWVGSVSALSISPSSVSFPSSAPTSTVVASGTVAWNVNLASLATSSWTLGVSAAAPACSTVPLSAITVRCTAITDTGIGVVTHACGLPISLSTAAQTVATGTDAVLVVSGHRTVTLQYSFSDSFKYTATTTPCNISFSYVLNSI